MDTGSLPGVKCGRGVLLTTHPLLVPRSWKSRAIPVPTLWGHTGPVTGSLYHYLLLKNANVTFRLVFLYILAGTFCVFCQQCRVRKVGWLWRAVLPTGEGMGMILTLCTFRTTWLACNNWSSFRSGTPSRATACLCSETCDIVCGSYVGVSCCAPIGRV